MEQGSTGELHGAEQRRQEKGETNDANMKGWEEQRPVGRVESDWGGVGSWRGEQERVDKKPQKEIIVREVE